MRLATPVPLMASAVVVLVNTSGRAERDGLRRREEVAGCRRSPCWARECRVGGRFSGLSLKLMLAHATAEMMLPYPTASTVVVTR